MAERRIMEDFLNYGEYNPDFCEYNPRSINPEKELRDLVKKVNAKPNSFFQSFMKRLVLSSSCQN